MATRKKLLHLKSGVVNANNTPKLPTSEQIELGEIAINYADGYETLAIKNSEGEIIPFTNSITMMEYVDSAISGLSITPVQTTGDSTTRVMSQSAVTRELGDKLSVSDFNTYSGAIETAFENVVQTGRSISTASGLTGGGDLSANRTIGLAATGTAGTYKTVIVDEYGRVTSGNSEGGGDVPAANYFIIGDTEGSASVPEFDAYTDTVHVTSQILTTSQKEQARTNIDALGSSDLNGYATQTWVGNQNFENKVSVVTANSASLTAEINKYYRYDSAVGTLEIILPVPSDTTHLSTIMFSLTTDSITDVTFTSNATIMYQVGYSIDSDTSYEINAVYNGSYWAIAAITLELPE